MKDPTAEVDRDPDEKMAPSPENVAGDDTEEFPTDQDSTEKKNLERLRKNVAVKRVWSIITWMPERCRWDPENPPKFNMRLNFLFGFVSVFSFPFDMQVSLFCCFGWRFRTKDLLASR